MDAVPTSPPRHHFWLDLVGWYGMVAIIAAYALVSLGIAGAHSAGYQLLNLTGALGLLGVSASKGVRQGVILNLFWAAIALLALLRLLV